MKPKFHFYQLAVILLWSTQIFGQGTLPGKRAHHALIYDPQKEYVLLIGGSSPENKENFGFYDDVWSFNGSNWKKEGVMREPRSGIAVAYDSKKGRILSLGGFYNNATIGELREMQGTDWKILTSSPDMAMAEGGLVYLPGTDKFVSFGGGKSRGVLHSTTWFFDGKDWSNSGASGPEGRQGHIMVYDSKRKKVVLFGGSSGKPNDILIDTWEFDGSAWTKMNLPEGQGPVPRIGAGSTYDSRRGQVIIFGGVSPGGAGVLGDTWAWDGKKWTPLATSGPKARIMGCLAYDEKRDRTVLFGGRYSWPNDANDTWEWDGKVWSEVKFQE